MWTSEESSHTQERRSAGRGEPISRSARPKRGKTGEGGARGGTAEGPSTEGPTGQATAAARSGTSRKKVGPGPIGMRRLAPAARPAASGWLEGGGAGRKRGREA